MRLCSWISCLATLSWVAAFGHGPQAPELTRQAALDQVLNPKLDPGGTSVADAWLNEQRRYEAGMDRLGREPQPNSSDLSLEAEVVRAACDRAANPSRYEELIEAYALHVNTQTRDRGPYQLRPEHIRESYRLAWECLLLRPPAMTEALGYNSRARQALELIRNDDSIPIIVRAFTKWDYVHDAHLAREQQQGVIDALASFRSERGLRTMLQCVSIAAKAQAGLKIRQGESFDPYAEAKSLLVPTYPPGAADAWQRVIAAYRRDPANKDTLKVLEAVLGARGIHP